MILANFIDLVKVQLLGLHGFVLVYACTVFDHDLMLLEQGGNDDEEHIKLPTLNLFFFVQNFLSLSLSLSLSLFFSFW
ncbi:hypothetical protein VNO80_05796 [Phaseolus coccineus]|uniref:Uncharacterized protein n=1 Tax=Phaseolus coccineus TaxID=3886 RepID=A0AAN9NKQ6_PHACN